MRRIRGAGTDMVPRVRRRPVFLLRARWLCRCSRRRPRGRAIRSRRCARSTRAALHRAHRRAGHRRSPRSTSTCSTWSPAAGQRTRASSCASRGRRSPTTGIAEGFSGSPVYCPDADGVDRQRRRDLRDDRPVRRRRRARDADRADARRCRSDPPRDGARTRPKLLARGASALASPLGGLGPLAAARRARCDAPPRRTARARGRAGRGRSGTLPAAAAGARRLGRRRLLDGRRSPSARSAP